MTSYFANKVVAITGGSDGIGKALVHELLLAGAKVATCGQSHDKLYQLQISHPGYHLHTLVTDLGKEADCEKFINSTIENFGGIDILINNAGVSMRALFQDLDVAVIQRVMDINFFGAVHCTKFALPSIMERKGDIAGVSSIAGYRGLPGRSGYCASKFALQGWLESLRTELLPSGVNVMWVSPAFTASNIRNAALNSDGEAQGESPMNEKAMMTAEVCARHILKALSRRKRSVVLSFNGKRTVWINRLFPRLADKLTFRYFFNKSGDLVK